MIIFAGVLTIKKKIKMAYQYQITVIGHYPNSAETALIKENMGAIVGDASCINHTLSLCGFPKIKKSLLNHLWVVEPKNEGFANLPINFRHNAISKACWKKETLFLKIERLAA